MDFQKSGSADAAVDGAEDQSQQRADAVHGFEFLFVRLAPIVFAVFLIGIVIMAACGMSPIQRIKKDLLRKVK